MNESTTSEGASSAQEMERSRIARELHDDISQQASGTFEIRSTPAPGRG
jgi:signal transduction histidine kinase